MTITVGAPPKAKDHKYTTGRGIPLEVSAANGLLSDATDAEKDPVTAEIDTPPNSDYGDLTFFDPDTGAFTFMPKGDFKGDVTFTYRAKDVDGKSDPATVTITVGLKPQAKAHSYAVAAGQTLQVDAPSGVLDGTTTDAEDDAVTAVVKDFPQHGQLSRTDGATGNVNDDGSFTYIPDPNFRGTDTFTFVAHDDKDGDSEVATVTILVGVPGAVDDNAYKVAGKGTLTVSAADGVLANDSGAGNAKAVVVGNVGHGTLDLKDDGSFTYTPAEDFRGPDSFTYLDQDRDAPDVKSNTAKVTITVGLPPKASDDSYSVARDTTLTVDAANGVLHNDTDAEGDQLTAVRKDDPAHGRLDLSDDGSFTYTPGNGYRGPDSFTYVAHDQDGDSEPATVTIQVGRPTAPDHAYSVDPPDTLTVSAADGLLKGATGGEGPLTAVLQDGPAHGRLLDFAANGQFTYLPDLNFRGDDTFTYFLQDLGVASPPATVTIHVGMATAGPIAQDHSYQVARDGVLSVDEADGLLQGATDPDNGPLAAVIQGDPAHGQLAANPDGSFLYTPDPDYRGSDEFKYVVHTLGGDSDPATVTLTVGVPPQIVDHAYKTGVDQALSTTAADGLLAGSHDAEGDFFTVELKDAPANAFTETTDHGSVTISNTDGSFTYTPDTGFSGTDTFEYLAHDQDGDSEPATVTIEVKGVVVKDQVGGRPVVFTSSATFSGPIVALPPPAAPPDPSVQFPIGTFQFSVSGLGPGGAATVTLEVPEGVTVNSYWKYGPTPDNLSPHWYDFAFDGTTGAEIDGNQITLHFVDGQRGDDDVGDARHGLDGILQDPGGPAFAPASSLSQRYVNHLYESLLHREAEAAGLAAWAGALDRGVLDRLQIAFAIENSPEARMDQVDGLYLAYLGRHANGDPGARGWVALLEGGGPAELVLAGILGSDEYLQARTADGTFDGWLDSAYARLFQRPVDAGGRAAWEAAFSGGQARAQVALALLDAPAPGAAGNEYHRGVVEGYYQQYLGRPAGDDPGSAGWVGQLQQGGPDEQVLAAILAGDEFFTRGAP